MSNNKKRKVFIKHSNYLKIFNLSIFGETKDSFEDNPNHIALINEYKYGTKIDFYQKYRDFIKKSDVIKDNKKDSLMKLLNNANIKKLISKNDIEILDIKKSIKAILTEDEVDKVKIEKPELKTTEKIDNKQLETPYHFMGSRKSIEDTKIKSKLTKLSLNLEVLKMCLSCR